MTEKDTREMQAALAKPFAPEDLEWRLQNTIEESMRGMAVPYVTNRAIQNRLDEVCGPENWYNEFKPWHSNGKKDAQLCGIAIYFEGKGFITKWDGAEDSDIEPIKGGLSDSMKRAAYRWLSSRNLPNGTRSYSWVHVTGDRTRKRAFLTEGPLKGDVASFLAKDALFICIGGVNALHGLTDTIRELGVHEVVEAMDMGQMTNSNVRNAILAMRKEVQKIPGIRYAKYTWNPAYKGVDDYLLSRTATM